MRRPDLARTGVRSLDISKDRHIHIVNVSVVPIFAVLLCHRNSLPYFHGMYKI